MKEEGIAPDTVAYNALISAFIPASKADDLVWQQATKVRLIGHENIPALPAYDWSVMRICPRSLRMIGPS
eukprot:7802756-Pyramimonas_sp.AAC.1